MPPSNSGPVTFAAMFQMLAPSLRQGFYMQDAFEQFVVVCPTVVKTVDVRDCDGVGIAVKNFDGRAGGNPAFFGHRKIVAAETAGDETLDHVVTIEADGELITRDARLGNDQQCGANAEAISDVERVLG